MTENVIDCRPPAALVYFLLNASASGFNCGNSFLSYLTAGYLHKYSYVTQTTKHFYPLYSVRCKTATHFLYRKNDLDFLNENSVYKRQILFSEFILSLSI